MLQSKNKMKLFIILLLFANSLFSEEIRLLVDPFKKEQGQPVSLDWIGGDIADSVSMSLSKLNGIKLLNTQDRSKVLNEIGMTQMLGTEEKDSRGMKVDPFAKQLKANMILNGKYGVQSGNISVTFKIINVATSEFKLFKVSDKYDPETLNNIYDMIVFEIVKDLESNKTEGVDLLVISEEDRKRIKVAKRYNPKAIELYYNGRQISFADPQKALELFQKAIAIEPKYADAIVQVGSILSSSKNQYDNASKEFEKAEAIYSDLDEKTSFHYIELLTLIAANYYKQNKFTDALDYYSRARNELEKSGMADSASMAYVEYGTAISYSGMNQKNKALEYFEKSKTIFQNYEMEKTAGYANLLYGMAYIQLANENLDESLDNFKNAYEIYVSKGMEKRVTTAGIAYSIAYIYEKKGNKVEAAKNYRKAYQIYQSIGYQGKEKEAVKKGAERNE